MIGVDEVGRGAWAGPLLVAAVRLSQPIEGLTDSKLLTLRQRELLCLQIQTSAEIGFGWLSASRVDTFGLAAALRQCTEAAVEALTPHDSEPIIIDGSVNLLGNNRSVITQPKAELSYPCVAAASIVAKVWRDRYMTALHIRHPEYAFASHVGYGTKAHLSAIQLHGCLPLIHRFSFKPIADLAA